MSEIKFPLAGDVSQVINPWALWIKNLSAQTGFININNIQSNNPELERNIIENVASYGQQLDKLHDVIGILIKQLPADLTEKQKQNIDSYVNMTNKIEQSKINAQSEASLLAQLDSVLNAISKNSKENSEVLQKAKLRAQEFIDKN